MLHAVHYWLSLGLLLGWYHVPASAQTIVLNDSRPDYVISHEVEVLEDAQGLLTLEDVRSQPLTWKKYPSVPNFGFSNKVYWVRMTLHNQSPTNQLWYLELGYPNHDYLEFYHELGDGSFGKKETGDRWPFAHRDVRYHNFVFQLDLPSGESRSYYLRSKTESSMQFPLHIWSPTAFSEKINREVFGLGIYYGMMLVIILYNFFIFLWLRNLNYLIYVLYISSFALYQLAINGFALEYLFSEQPDVVNFVVPISGGVAALFAQLFSRNFLQTAKYCPRFDKVLQFFLATTACFLVLACFASYSVSIKFGSVMILGAIPCIITSSVLCLKNGYRPARYFFAAFLALLVGAFLYHLRNLGLFPSFFLSDYGNHIGSSVEVILLSLALADKIKIEQMENQRKIEGLNTELENQIKTVEYQVEEKTRDIKSILENIRQGIFMILPNGFRIHKDHSAHLQEILGRDDVEQTNAIDLLLKNSSLSADEINQVKSVLEVSLEQDEVNFTSNAHCLPGDIVYRSAPDAPGKSLRIDWSPIVGAEHKIEKILVAIRDETHLKELQARAQTQQQELEYISQIIEIPQDRFARFIELSYQYLDQNEQLLHKPKVIGMETLKTVFINTHTLKGMSRNYGLKQLIDSVHRAEGYLKAVQADAGMMDRSVLIDDQACFRADLDLYVRVNADKLGRGGTFETVEFSVSKVEAMLKACGEGSWDAVSQALTESLYAGAAGVLRSACSRAHLLAKDLGKEAPLFQIDADGLAFNRQGVDLVEAVLIHLIRNSLDHGIERKEQRQTQGKIPSGTIRMVLAEAGDHLQFIYSDDGQGLPLHDIRDKAVAQKLIHPKQSPSPAQLAELIFQAGLSTSAQVTDISGQGIGLDAVRTYLERQGGSIGIRLLGTPGADGCVPFEFHIRIPLNLYVAVGMKRVA
ncbi:MAG TPA: 7TM diverse intracellular signaling domain-containing protein [Oligoflexus sp.]|uniref:7TM diverse intracellular signaling domain-containing protein n=1 Tax=Oligoflexus sp. TaxID=1971216 RepID=UPI002D691D9A|nr:7TM diverse intracellular signaling domain-containing protein [Oligoflexus sp.]HYX31561.1 7TM diverse intracellular signaling domain-containing protein [Oligoflexus sp.]